MKKLFAILISAGVMLSLAACSGNPQPANQSSAAVSSSNPSSSEESFQSAGSSPADPGIPEESSLGISEAPPQEDGDAENMGAPEAAGTQITLTIGDMEIPAVLNDTVAAQSFKEMLPFTVTASKGQYDYCGVGEDIAYDEDETQAGWKNGDIGYARGWFALFHSGEEESSGYTSEMIIGHMDDSYLDSVRDLPGSVEITVELADGQ